MKLFLFLSILFSLSVDANFRAREHYDYHQLKVGGESYTYRGLSNTINYFFKEEAMQESLGLGISTLGDNVENKKLSESRVGGKISLYQLDLEYKWFPQFLWDSIYLRHGLGYSLLDTDKLGVFHGIHYQQAIGNEIKFKHFGLGLEFSAQSILLERGATSLTTGAAIGFHFYRAL